MSWWWGGHYSPYPGRAHEPKVGRYLGAPGREEHRHHHKSRHHKRRDTGYASQWQKSDNLSHHYKYINELKKGGQSASVEVVKSVRSGKLRVIKRVTGKGRPRAELDALKRIPKDVNLNYMVEYTHPRQDEVFLVLEYCDGGDLKGLLEDHIYRGEAFHEGFIWDMIHDIGCALSFLHQGIRKADTRTHCKPGWDVMVHGDIKPHNIFLSREGAKGRYPRMVLGDFGCTITGEDVSSGRESKTQHRHRTDCWKAPESFASIVGKDTAVGRPTDIWQLGAVAACLCRLMEMPDRETMFRDSNSHCGSRYSKRLNEMVGWCMEVNRHRRPRAIELVHSANKEKVVKLRK